MKVERNVGGTDRGLRIAAGIALMAAIPFNESPLRWIGLAGMMLLITGLAGYCPLYTPLRLNTSPQRKPPRS